MYPIAPSQKGTPWGQHLSVLPGDAPPFATGSPPALPLYNDLASLLFLPEPQIYLFASVTVVASPRRERGTAPGPSLLAPGQSPLPTSRPQYPVPGACALGLPLGTPELSTRPAPSLGLLPTHLPSWPTVQGTVPTHAGLTAILAKAACEVALGFGEGSQHSLN